jgi:hypothetical protein
MRKGKPTLCEKCGFEISSFYFKQHQRVCDGGGPGRRKEKSGKKFSPGGWNKGLTKDTDPRVAKYSKSISERQRGSRRELSEEQRKVLSERMSATARKYGFGGYRKHGGKGKRGAYRGYWCDSSWELAWVIFHLEKQIPFKRNTQGFLYKDKDGRDRLYYPDFILEDGTYVEIKGWINPTSRYKIADFPSKLILMGSPEMKPILDHVIKTHGRDFTNLYETIA